ncbi:MAG: VWA-like domain-containing protein, partial [bacterium]|nr:VWA-like domain-containing protein [bacterium]
GSISVKDLQDFFAEIEEISSGHTVELVTFDVQVQPVNGEYVRAYRRGDWRRINLKGGGGTSFVNAFHWVDEHRLWAACNVVLTDGCALWPKGYAGLELIWCLTKGRHAVKPPFGDVVRIGGENR